MEGLPKRHILIPVDESQGSEKVVSYCVDHMYRPGDELHLFHVIPPGQYVVLSSDLGMEEIVEDDENTQKKVDTDKKRRHGVVDMLQEAHAHEFIKTRFVSILEARQIPYQVEIVKFSTDNDSIGAIVCKRAEQLQATAVVMAKHNKGAIKEFFVGSVCNYCTHHSKAPVLVLHVD